MPFIEFLDKRRKWDTFVVIAVIVACVICCAGMFVGASNMVRESRQKIYILDGMAVPYVATQTNSSVNIEVEAKAHIVLFHQLFFTLVPDESFIEQNIAKSMYLIDKTGMMQYNTLKEQGFYNNIISASANFMIMTDSVHFDKETMKFTYYGRQRIERPSSVLYRELVTEGEIHESTRSDNNPHGLMIVNYRTIRNRDIEQKSKRKF